jgi:hypothetical protein
LLPLISEHQGIAPAKVVLWQFLIAHKAVKFVHVNHPLSLAVVIKVLFPVSPSDKARVAERRIGAVGGNEDGIWLASLGLSGYQSHLEVRTVLIDKDF